MRSILFLSLLLLGQAFAARAQQEKYSRVSIEADAALYNRLQKMGLAVDHVHRHGNSLVAELSETELNTMQAAGISFTVEIENLQKYYEERAKNDLAQNPMQRQLIPCGEPNPADTVQVPANFSLGTMGGFFKYSEMLAHLDNMAALYPDLISVRDTIPGYQTIQGRPIYWVKISDNPTQDEVATEPQVLYDAVHHAREPMSMAQTIFYMYYLLENYNSNALVKDIVDNTELFFVPCLNPDGYIYNQNTAPNGGGMWRKNRRNNGGSFGVDLNRNYGYLWGFDNQGSSPDPTTEVYRGAGPFSEPETQAM
ncbi:MAG: peptidase M14, partial [Sphingobacteriales bacterium]